MTNSSPAAAPCHTSPSRPIRVDSPVSATSWSAVDSRPVQLPRASAADGPHPNPLQNPSPPLRPANSPPEPQKAPWYPYSTGHSMQPPGEPSPAVSVDGIPRRIDVRRPPRKSPRCHGRAERLEVKSSGYAEFNRQADESVEKGLLTAESTAIPTTLLLLILVFRSAAAAPLPLAVAGVSVVGSPAIPVVVAQLTSVPVFATDLTTALLLGPGTAPATATAAAAMRGPPTPTSAHQRPPAPTRSTANRSGPRSRGAPIRNETVISGPSRGHTETPSSLSSHRSEGVS
ncbi:MMPL family transporter [Streptomyces microflavus]|uniref:MMPL family transporter n=1 Tax=Streptomyces microflavus TaxID=1919 RepID=UPI0038035EDC